MHRYEHPGTHARNHVLQELKFTESKSAFATAAHLFVAQINIRALFNACGFAFKHGKIGPCRKLVSL